MGGDKKRYVIVGASAAGMSAAKAIRELDEKGEIIVLSDEPHAPYFRPMLPYVLSGEKSASAIALAGRGPYTAENVTIRLSCRAASVDPEARTVTTPEGGTLDYDRILFATGGNPRIPENVPGTDSKGVFALRRLGDAKRMAAALPEVGTVVMIGAGLLNIRIASVLSKMNLKITIVESAAAMFPKIMEPKDTVLLQKALTDAGIDIATGSTVKRIVSGKNGVAGAVLSDGRELPCDMVCIGAGIIPDTDFLKGCGIKTDQGIIIDRFTACNAPSAYAAGDVAVIFNKITGERITTGLWTNAADMGRCAGINMAGRRFEFPGTFGVLNASRVVETPFIAMGVVHTAGTDYETHIRSGRDTYSKLVFNSQDNALIGALFMGDISNAGVYRHLITEGLPVNGFKKEILEHRLNYGHFTTRP